MRSADGRITVSVPGNAFDRPLELVHRTPTEQRPILRGRGQAEPPPIASFRRGFGTFHLEATDDAGRQVKKFNTPLTLTIRFTPQQLQVLGIAPDDLRIFWFDEDQIVDRGKGGVVKGLWVPQLTTVDAQAGTATLVMDHFSAFQLSDGSSPSAAYLPSLQGWQVDSFTGAASVSYPIEVPPGPAGLAPDLRLTYSAAATDGPGGMRSNAQASWVGKGWSLDTGAVALHKIQITPYSTVNHYALAFGGRSYTLIRGEALVANPDGNNPTHWAWRPTDESYIRVRVVQNGVSAPGSLSSPGRGAWDYGTALPRYTWQVWTKDGTRYDFAEDVWWLWAKCSGTGAFAQSESNRWLLSSVTDTSGNSITYQYGRSKAFFSSCMGQAGTVDFDVWPTEILWAGGRYRVEFVSSARTFDTQFDWPEYTVGGPVRETRRLDAIRVWSNPSGSWQLVRQYNFGYGSVLRSDARVCTNAPTCSTWGPDGSTAKLTLTSAQRVANDGATALPATTFGYQTSGGGSYHADGGWNRLNAINNGQGGSLSLSYANIATATGYGVFKNRHRVTTRTATDGRGNSYTWSYSYGTAQVNTIGTILRPDDPSGSATPTSATLYYNVFLDGDSDFDQESWLVQQTWQEFRGHSTVTETDPSGAKTRRTFLQGNAGCVPATGARGSHGAITADPCFQELQRQEFLKGRETRLERLSSGNTLLAETVRSYTVGPVDHSWAPLAGLWRAFSYERVTEERAWEGGSTPSTKRTEYVYSAQFGTDLAGMCNPGAPLQAYGNLTCMKEYDRGTLVRQTVYAYNTPVTTASSYIVDRNIVTTVLNSSQHYLAHTMRFYDGYQQSLGTVGARGLLTREIAFDVPAGRTHTTLTNTWLYGRDTAYSYDSWGNQTGVTTYTGAGSAVSSGAWTVNPPGNGSAARTTTTTYDATFHAFPTRVTNALGHTEDAGYDYRMGTLTSVTDANNQITSATYDSFGRFSTLIRPGDSASMPTIFATYHDYELPVRYAVSRREVQGQSIYRPVSRFYDGLGRLIQEKAESQDWAQNIVTDYRYDGLGRLTQQSQSRYVGESGGTFWSYTPTPSSGVAWTTTAYDALGRVSSVTEADGAFSSYQYGVEVDRRWQHVIDANRHRTVTYLDSFGRPLQVLALSGNCGGWGYTCTGSTTTPWTVYATTTYGYSPLDLLTQVIDAKGNVTSINYDSLGRKRSMSDPDMGVWSYSYDANGNLISQTDGKGQTTTFRYDLLDRVTERSAGGWVRYYAYDEAFGNGKGRRTGMSTWVGGQQQAYQNFWHDARGRLGQTSLYLPGTTHTFAYSYDSADRVRTITYPSGELVTYTYDAAWRQRSVCGTSCYVTNASYTALDQPDLWTLSNGLHQDWDYDLRGRLSQLRLGTSAAPGSAFDRSYSYDPVSNVTSIRDNQTGQSQLFRYDAQDRLTSASAITTSSSSISVRARGDYAGGAWPVMELRVNRTAVAAWTVSSASWASYSVMLGAPVDADDEVDILFTETLARKPTPFRGGMKRRNASQWCAGSGV